MNAIISIPEVTKVFGSRGSIGGEQNLSRGRGVKGSRERVKLRHSAAQGRSFASILEVLKPDFSIL